MILKLPRSNYLIAIEINTGVDLQVDEENFIIFIKIHYYQWIVKANKSLYYTQFIQK